MTYSCSQCDYVAQFESALKMHQQLHHDKPESNILNVNGTSAEKSKTMPRSMSPTSIYSIKNYNKGSKLLNRTSSATRLFDKLRARICRSRTSLSAHPEEIPADNTFNELSANDTCMDVRSEGTSKVLKRDMSRISAITTIKETRETYSCHLCNFDADRITVLDRHLLNDHKIGLETLLKLVMAKTREGLNEAPAPTMFGIRQPYYNSTVDFMEEGEFVIETVAPKIKILKNSATNTDLKMTDIPDLKDDCQMITKELEKLMTHSEESGKEDFLGKMQTLNEYMCRFVNSSNTLKKTLTKEFSSKNSVRERLSGDQQLFELSLGETDTPRDWERCHSEKMERSRTKYSDNNSRTDTPRDWERCHSEKMERSRTKYSDNNSRGDKKLVAESFYF